MLFNKITGIYYMDRTKNTEWQPQYVIMLVIYNYCAHDEKIEFITKIIPEKSASNR